MLKIVKSLLMAHGGYVDKKENLFIINNFDKSFKRTIACVSYCTSSCNYVKYEETLCQICSLITILSTPIILCQFSKILSRVLRLMSGIVCAFDGKFDQHRRMNSGRRFCFISPGNGVLIGIPHHFDASSNANRYFHAPSYLAGTLDIEAHTYVFIYICMCTGIHKYTHSSLSSMLPWRATPRPFEWKFNVRMSRCESDIRAHAFDIDPSCSSSLFRLSRANYYGWEKNIVTYATLQTSTISF